MDSNTETARLASSKNNSNKHLPPIQRDELYYKDNFKNSFLMRYDLKKQQDEKRKAIM
jgi:hypothetical protein